MASKFLVRKNIENLPDEELKNVRNAYRKIMRLPKNDRRSYHYLAGLHDVPGGYCWHDPKDHQGFPDVSLFLPWHRAYLYKFEKSLQDQEHNVTIPYWDWIIDDQEQELKIPSGFSVEKDIENNPNPLYKFHINFPELENDRDTERFSGSRPIPRVTAKNAVDEVVNDPDDTFAVFSENLRRIHNYIHGWTGGMGIWKDGRFSRGDMGTTDYAAFDPIFWSHHCMIDKLWWEWQTRWGVQNIPDDWKEMPLEPFELKVRDVLDIHLLGYDYGTDGNTVEGNWG